MSGTVDPAVSVTAAGSVAEGPLGSVGVQQVLLGEPCGDNSPMLLGLSTVEAGRTSPLIEHDTAEVAYVTVGTGAMVTDRDEQPFAPGDAILIDAHCWHAIRADAETRVQMVFAFPTPELPPTRRREDE